jgi:hypothetical protein
MDNENIKVTVRWHDGYLEEFDATEVRFGHALLWMRLTNGGNRHIPLIGNVRWFSTTPESHENIKNEKNC